MNDKCPECGGVMRLEFSDLGGFWICSNEKCDVDEIGYVFTEEKYYEWQRAKEIEYEFNKMLWKRMKMPDLGEFRMGAMMAMMGMGMIITSIWM